MAVEGDLSSNTQLEVKKHGSLLLVDDIQFANFKLDGRWALHLVVISAVRSPNQGIAYTRRAHRHSCAWEDFLCID